MYVGMNILLRFDARRAIAAGVNLSRCKEEVQLLHQIKQQVLLAACLADVQTIYWAKASAIESAPLPSFPKNNNAWLNLFCKTRSARCFFISCLAYYIFKLHDNRINKPAYTVR